MTKHEVISKTLEDYARNFRTATNDTERKNTDREAIGFIEAACQGEKQKQFYKEQYACLK